MMIISIGEGFFFLIFLNISAITTNIARMMPILPPAFYLFIYFLFNLKNLFHSRSFHIFVTLHTCFNNLRYLQISNFTI